LADLKINFLL